MNFRKLYNQSLDALATTITKAKVENNSQVKLLLALHEFMQDPDAGSDEYKQAIAECVEENIKEKANA